LKDLFAQGTDAGGKGLDRRILELFRGKSGGVVSGEELSCLLGVSRTAVWKHIKTLRAIGYRIDAVPSQGYRLISSPDILVPAEISAGLSTRRIGRRLICFRETESTNMVAFRMAEEGAEEGTVVVAEAQHQGKGRLGRRWESPPGVNLYCSLILRPPVLPTQASQLTFLSAVAVARAIAAVTTLQPAIKWPNDLLVEGRKVAGLLIEMSAETEKVHFVVLGIGVNINMTRDQFPSDLRHPATSLALETGREISRLEFTRALLTALDDTYEIFLTRGYEAIRDEWLSHCSIMGREVRIMFHESATYGMVMGIDEDGALLLRLHDGRIERVIAGDVTLL
jgi:BirA family biotin operon repressor/biotin-[acetyl-CoA-carboxylase] ligase